MNRHLGTVEKFPETKDLFAIGEGRCRHKVLDCNREYFRRIIWIKSDVD
jgi:hypothetical protein